MGILWTLVLGFALTLGPLFVKTYRISAIFNNKTLKQKLHLTNGRLLLYLLALVLVEVAILLALQLDSPLDKVVLLPSSGDEWTYFESCGSDSGLAYVLVLFFLNMLVALAAAYITFRVRKVDEAYNESSYLFIAIDNIVAVSTIAAVVIGITYKTAVNLNFVFLDIVINFLVITTHGILLASKLHALREFTEGKTRTKTTFRGSVEDFSIKASDESVPAFV